MKRRQILCRALAIFSLAGTIVGLGVAILRTDGDTFDKRQKPSTPDHALTTARQEKAPIEVPTARAASAPDSAQEPSKSQPGPSLFRFRPPPRDAEAIEARLDAATDRVHYLELNRDLLLGKESPAWQNPGTGRFLLPLPDGSVQAMRVRGAQSLGPRRFVVDGSIEGRELSRVLIAVNHDAVSAQILDSELGEYQLRSIESVEGALGQLWKVDPSKLGGCGGQISSTGTAGVANSFPSGSGLSADGETSLSGSQTTASDVAGGLIVRLLFLYTSAVRKAYGLNQVGSIIDLTIAGTNSDLSGSQIPVKIELAAAQEVDLNESSVSYSATLGSLKGMSDGVLDQVHVLRDQVAADLVALGVDAADTGGSAGIAYVMDDPTSYSKSFFGFSVVRFGSMNSGNVLSHELGHNFGCTHDRENSSGHGAYPYSYGYRFFAQDSTGQNRQFRDIMSYAPGTRVPFFSNPRLVLSNLNIGSSIGVLREAVALGIPAGLPGESDNARTIDQTAFSVSNYRASPQNPYSAGTLINVSTRAWVGEGARQLIGGFVITGSGDKAVLVRAAGPSLVPYGVTDALPDPILRLYRQGESTPFAVNDNWWDQPDANLTTRAGFPFSVGGKDSSLFRMLPPGGYTANIEGVGGGTGTALVEAYEIERGGAKLINLSTRAYADPEHPIIAGFVIDPDPGAPARTKRLLIRVLGSTLANYGVPDGMQDPMLQLHDSRGELLLENDDWDPPNTRMTNSPSLVRGTVDQYSEQMVFDAIKSLGITEMKPVEPAIVVDLAPGSYTVVVKPFEDLTSNQPARSGVGLIEVYELQPR